MKRPTGKGHMVGNGGYWPRNSIIASRQLFIQYYFRMIRNTEITVVRFLLIR